MRREKEKQAVVPRTLMKDDFFFSRESVYGWAGLEIPRYGGLCMHKKY